MGASRTEELPTATAVAALEALAAVWRAVLAVRTWAVVVPDLDATAAVL